MNKKEYKALEVKIICFTNEPILTGSSAGVDIPESLTREGVNISVVEATSIFQ